MLNFVFIHRALTGYNFFQQQAELWNVPFAAAQFVKALSLCFVGIGRELYIERPTCGDDPQVSVEDDQGFTNGVNHRLRERTGVFDLAELLAEHV